ncbi:hypothetical protein FJ546_21870 [Mesorhizobium sp. B2-4-19]|nr:hypothetical protein FJ546_21870 [Mesorhizobium sp. B2-4-19]
MIPKACMQKARATARAFRLITNPSVFDSSQNRGVLIPVCSRSESETFRESWVISRRAEVCQQSEGAGHGPRLFCWEDGPYFAKTSKRSAFITLVHALTKSLVNFALASADP